MYCGNSSCPLVVRFPDFQGMQTGCRAMKCVLLVEATYFNLGPPMCVYMKRIAHYIAKVVAEEEKERRKSGPVRLKYKRTIKHKINRTLGYPAKRTGMVGLAGRLPHVN